MIWPKQALRFTFYVVQRVDNSMPSKPISDYLPQIDPAKCIACELCVKVCGNHVLRLINNLAVIAKPAACTYSGACEAVCPTGAITLAYEIVLASN